MKQSSWKTICLKKLKHITLYRYKRKHQTRKVQDFFWEKWNLKIKEGLNLKLKV